jgi:UDP-N-acetylmuramoylalanine--D-glutamate ligase
VGAALLARQQGADVFLSDLGTIADRYRAELEAAGIPYEMGQHTEARILAADEVIKSPGIPERVPLVQKLLAQGTPVIGEIEYAGRYTEARLIAITGSNGKTTTVYLTHHLLQAGGVDSALVGNVGVSFARALAEGQRPDIFVIEMSSFQLDSIEKFRPHLAAILNITPDHLDRYNHEMASYIASKLRITMNQLPEDHFWYLQEDANVASGRAKVRIRATEHPLTSSAVVGHTLRLDGRTIDLGPTQLRGRHNALNALFAVEIARACGLTLDQLEAGLRSFQPVPHRLEPVGEVDGIRFINDSKATNVDAVGFALAAMDRPIIWIAGGQDKGNDYDPLHTVVREKVKALVCLGKDNRKLRAAFAPLLDNIVETASMADAVAAARQLASPGEVVLLSPACASFDLFKNYIDRGDQFRAAVQREGEPSATK